MIKELRTEADLLSSSGKIKIGIAEDNLEFCQVLRDYLESYPDLAVAAVANDGLEALEILRTSQLDLLLLDMIMPKLDGIAVLERIKRTSNRPKIIILSAFGHEDITRKAVELGADYFIVKPFDLQILVNGSGRSAVPSRSPNTTMSHRWSGKKSRPSAKSPKFYKTQDSTPLSRLHLLAAGDLALREGTIADQ